MDRAWKKKEWVIQKKPGLTTLHNNKNNKISR